MALSLLSHPNFTDLQTFLDPIRSSFDFSLNNDQMEYHNNNSSAINQHLTHNNNNNNSNNNRNYNNFASNQTQNAFNNDYDQVINFVDSPPNSEESWTDEQHQQQQTQQQHQQQQQQQQQQSGKIPTAGPRIIDVQTIFGQQQQQQQQQQAAVAAAAASGQRKRRMDWNPLEINQNGTSGTDSQSTAPKIPNLTNGNANNNTNNTVNTTINKEIKEKKKITNGNGSGRGSWADDIDFDLNADFNSTGYLNNEPFLSFSPALTVLKQEIHSPQADPLKGNKSPLNSINQENSLSSDNHDTEHQVSGTTAADLNETNNNASCGSPSSQHVTKSGYDSSKALTINGFSVNNNNNNQQQTDKSSSLSLISARKSPTIQPAADSSKTENCPPLADDYKFQYILAAATSIATKNNEETLTYLNQGQSYEIKLKKTGDLSFYRDKILKSVIKICFHERRLQYMEREQMQQWQASRPGERIIEVDVPLSYGLCHVSQPLNPNFLNTVEVFWDPLKEVGVYIKVNCISTEFTPKKHGGEKGVPFRIQIETYIENANNSPAGGDSTTNCNNLVVGGGVGVGVGGGAGGGGGIGVIGKQAIHAAACQIKVFKLKGADRKHKQDREKIQRRPVSEQEKFQPSYECTIMNDIPLDTLPTSAGCYSPEYMKLWPNSPVHIPKYDGIIPYANVSPTANSSPIAINSVTSTNTNNLKLMDANMVSPQQVELDDYQSPNIMAESTPAQVTQWLTYHRLTTYVSTFAHFSGSDVLRMSKEDLIQICGLADGIRMFNILHAKLPKHFRAIAPRLTIYISLDGSSYNAIYLTSNSSKELTQKIFKLPGFYELSASSSNMNGGVDGYPGWGMQSKYSGSGSNIFNDASKTPVYITGPSGVHVTITDEVLNNEIKDGSLYALEVQNGKVLMKVVNKNDN